MLPGSISTERFTCPKCGLGYQAIKEWFPDDVSGGRFECKLSARRERNAASGGGSTSTLSMPCRRAWTKIRMRCVLAA
jgi:hypothetical protein